MTQVRDATEAPDPQRAVAGRGHREDRILEKPVGYGHRPETAVLHERETGVRADPELLLVVDMQHEYMIARQAFGRRVVHPGLTVEARETTAPGPGPHYTG